jgi:hypothetical protein
MEVLKMLVEAGLDVLIQKDGTDGSGSLDIALTTNCDVAVVTMLVQANSEQSLSSPSSLIMFLLLD